MTLSTVLLKYPINTSWPVVVPGGDKEDHASVVQVDPGGMVSAVMEVGKLYE